MSAKRRMKMHLSWDEVIGATEHYLIQEWRDGRLERPTSPLHAAGVLVLHVCAFVNHMQGLPFPSEKEFRGMLEYIRDSYSLSHEFPCSNQELKDDMAAKMRVIQERLERERGTRR